MLVNRFVFDDILVIRENYFIKSFEHIPLLWNTEYFERFGEQSYRPLVSATYFLDYFLWELSPFGYHLDNFFLHLINASIIWIFFKRFFGNSTWTFFAAALFILHPVMTESVNVMGFREELLTVFFGMLSLLLFVEMYSKKNEVYSFFMGFGSILTFAAGALAKENMLVFPLLVILVHFK